MGEVSEGGQKFRLSHKNVFSAAADPIYDNDFNNLLTGDI